MAAGRLGALLVPLAGVQGAEPPEALEIVLFLRVQTGLESSICESYNRPLLSRTLLSRTSLYLEQNLFPFIFLYI